jgi:hypothetical protein
MRLDSFIETERSHSVQKTRGLFEVSRSAYHQRRDGAPSARRGDAELVKMIAAIHKKQGHLCTNASTRSFSIAAWPPASAG